MKLEVESDDLQEALSLAASVVKTKTPHEVYKYAKLAVTDDSAVITATDGEVWVSHTFPVIGKSSGVCLLPAQRALAIVRECSGDSLSLEADEAKAVIRSSRGRFTIQTMDPSEFGAPVEFTGAEFSVGGDELRDSINRTAFACDVASRNYAFGGVLLEFGNGLTVAATDSLRFAVCEIASTGKDTATAIVPQRVAQLVAKSIDGPAKILVGSSLVRFSLNHTEITARQVEGRFPKWRDILPNTFEHQVRLVAEPLQSVVRPAALFVNKETRGVDFDVSGGVLRLRSKLAEVGDSEVELPVEDGAEFSITFDPRFVLDFLKSIPPETPVNWGVINENSASLFSTDDGYRYVIMPLSR